MPRRDQRILLALAAVSMLFGVAPSLLGVSPDVLLAVPALLLLLPLLAGRYLGEDSIARLARAPRPRHARARSVVTPRRAPRVLARGGRLIADALAERGPPGALLAR